MATLLGVHKTQVGFTATGRVRTRTITSAERARTAELLAETQRVSDELRAKVGLPPVPPNTYRQAMAQAIGSDAKRKSVTAAQARELAAAALARIGRTFPADPSTADALIAELAA